MAGHRVQALLMGGQACVFYGAAEFSKDISNQHSSGGFSLCQPVLCS